GPRHRRDLRPRAPRGDRLRGERPPRGSGRPRARPRERRPRRAAVHLGERVGEAARGLSRGGGAVKAGDRPVVMTVVGARPQFVKAAPLSRALRRRVREVLVHTGQHYDHEMSQAFFDQLGIPAPDRHLGIGSSSHGRMTGRMLEALEATVLEVRPDMVVVLGDTNSTLAGALAAAKLGVPVAHVEAGLRSFDDRMPEEINRRLTDHVSSLLFCPTPTAVRNLREEGIRRGVHRVGDVMMDAVVRNLRRAHGLRPAMKDAAPGSYYLATLHRQENVDDPDRLAGTEPARILAAARAIERRRPQSRAGRLYGRGRASEAIATLVARFLHGRRGRGPAA